MNAFNARSSAPFYFAVATLTAGCDGPPPKGELVVVVDTDVAVPEMVGRLRVDLFTVPEGAHEDPLWFESRDVALGSADALPISFSLVNPSDTEAMKALVRVRLYPEGAVRRYTGESYEPPEPAPSLVPSLDVAELCDDPPLLELGGQVIGRRGRESLFDFEGSAACAALVNHNGSVAARLAVEQAGVYQLEAEVFVDESSPSSLAQVTLELRRACAEPSTAIDCDVGVFLEPVMIGTSRLSVELEPGDYYVVTGGAVLNDGYNDLRLVAWNEEVPRLSLVPVAPEPPARPFAPLLNDDQDSTPVDEPDPIRAIDKLFLAQLDPGERRVTLLSLLGDCLGRNAKLGDADGVVRASEAESCASASAPALPVAEAQALPFQEPLLHLPSAVGTFATHEPCAPDDSSDRFVCVPSGAFVAGDTRGATPGSTSYPLRPAALRRYWLDRYEVTAGDFQDAIDAEFRLPWRDMPEQGEPIWPTSASQAEGLKAMCSWREGVADEERRARPLNCINWYGAQGFCQWRGGDLPTMAEWEFAALRAGGDHKRLYPWGEVEPACSCESENESCRSAVFARAVGELAEFEPYSHCLTDEYGPLPVNLLGGPNGDVSTLGLVGLTGNVMEYTRDAARPLADGCWAVSGVWQPTCVDRYAVARQAGGSSYADALYSPAFRRFIPASDLGPSYGFRCSYATRPF